MSRSIAIASGVAAVLAGLLTGTSLLKEARFDLEVLVLLGWVIGPYALFVLLAWFARRSAPAGAAVLLGVLASAGFAAWAIHDAFKPPREALAGLVFVAIPFYQGAALLASAVAVGILRSRSRRSPPP